MSELKADAAPSSDEPTATVDLNFSEATLFIDWIQQVVGRLGKEASIAAVPMEQKENKSAIESQAAAEWLLRAGFSPVWQDC